MRKLLALLPALALGLAAPCYGQVVRGDASLKTPAYGTQTVGLSTNYFQGQYLIYNAPFNTGSASPFSVTTQYNPTFFPAMTKITWSYPPGSNHCGGGGICGYMNFQYGWQNDSAGPVAVTPTLVNALNTLTQNINITFLGTASGLDGFDFIDDIFTSSTCHNSATNNHEIEIFLHSNSDSIAFMNGQTQDGNFTDQYGRVWQTGHSASGVTGSDLVMMPLNRADISGLVDIKGVLNYFVGKGLMAGTDCFNGFQIGSEPFRDTASAAITSHVMTQN